MKIDTIPLITCGNQTSTTLPMITKKQLQNPIAFVYCGLITAVDQTFLANRFVVLFKYMHVAIIL